MAQTWGRGHQEIAPGSNPGGGGRFGMLPRHGTNCPLPAPRCLHCLHSHTHPANTQVPRAEPRPSSHCPPSSLGFCGAQPRPGYTSSLSTCYLAVVGAPGQLFWALLECSLWSRTPKLKADRLMGFSHGVTCPRAKW